MSQLWFQAGRQRGLLPVLRRSGEGGKRQCGYGQRGPEQRRCGLVRAEHLAGGAHCAPAAPNSDPWQQQNAGEATVTNGTNPPDYLTINIVLTVVSVFVCCFSCLSIAALVTGIIGIVMSTQVRSAIQAHNYALAEQKSKAAKNMWIATAVILGVSVLLGLLLAVTGFMTGFMEEFYSGLY